MIGILGFWLVLSAAATAFPASTSESTKCAGFVQQVEHGHSNFHLLNSSWVAAEALNVSSTLNAIPFCRIFGAIPYAINETLSFEVWLPTAVSYTGRYASVGNGGFAGAVDELGLMTRLNEGFAVAGSDSGHSAAINKGTSLPFFHNRAETLAWIRNSVALFTPVTRRLTAKFYSDAPAHSYYFGCSTGGAQGLALAQHHPELFDGIYAGSPGNWYSHLMLSFLWNSEISNGSGTMNQETLDAITAAVLTQCDALDGVQDGVLENPLDCAFNISSLACEIEGANQTTCLTPAQVDAANAIYAGPKDARTGKEVYPGFEVGSESSWALQEGPLANEYAVPLLQNLVFRDENFEASAFDWGSDIDVVDAQAGPLIDNIDPELTALRNYGTKLVITQGWADPFNAPTLPIEYLKEVQKTLGGDVSDFLRLFMVPGGGHCGPNAAFPHVPGTYQAADVLVNWVEQGQRPEYMLSTDPPDGSDGTRRLCSWPQTAHYIGGDITSYSSYKCS